MEYVAGIDGGGTKTVAILADLDGTIVAQTSGGPTNPNVISGNKLFDTLKTLLDELEQMLPNALWNVSVLFAGIAGTGNNASRITVEQVLKQLLFNKTRIRVEPDTINALYSGTYGKHGIVHISGTGSITYGINAHGVHGRVGGWGYLFGDEGSGYDIGRKGIMRALKAHDGRGPDTVLLKRISSDFEVSNPYDLVRKIYTSESPKNKISPVAKLVFQAYKQNDIVAQQIISDTSQEIKESIGTLYMKLFEKGQNVKVVLCGGVFQEKEILPRLLKEELKHDSNIELIMPNISPAGGAIIGAFLMRNGQLNHSVIKKLQESG
ncbi:N-acetylglucosamine kinase [Virgibacillus ihumii]|uniref:N-acetylglucosamine kinase n=1 Tax=Virgibacillus ihumii TaxID=2686091 RepID=UPI00157CC670|nr:BadF/BadG/BcrA/BcrD ATPase family protein [Virgibacillus ihumii]